MIHHTLSELGFNHKEIEIYLMILKHGKLRPSEIAQLTNINRTTVYSTAKELVKRGIISEDIGSSTRTFIARDPKSLTQLYKKEEKKLANKKLFTMRAVRELHAFSNAANYSVPNIIFVEADDIEAHLYRQSPLWNKSILERNSKWLGYQSASFVEYYEAWIDWYWDNVESSKNITLQLLSTEKAEDIKKKKFPRRHIRFWNQAKDFTATTWIMGDYVTMIQTDETPHTLIEIYNPAIAHNMREVFTGIWKEIE